MPLMMDGGPSKPRLDAICTMIFHFTAAVLFLTCPCRGQSQMVSPSQPIVATVGQDIMLPCHLEPAVNVTDKTVEWTRPDLNPRFVYVWRDGVELEMKKHQSYVGRTSVSITKLKHGDISLKLCKVKISDKGKYRCFIPTLSRESTVELVVGAVSSLTVSFMRTDNDLRGVVLQCESAGWYPEPEVLWLDGEGNLLSAGPTETVRGPDDLYTVSSRVTVEKRHSNSFTCRVQQRNINQTTETHIQVPDDVFNAVCSSAAPVTIGLAVVSMVILALVFVVWKWRQKQNCNNFMRKETKATTSALGNDTELQLLNEEKRETLPVMAESTTVKDVDQEKLDVKLKEVEEECKDVEGLHKFLAGHKNNLHDQMHHLGLQLHDIEMQRDEIMSGVEKIKQKWVNNDKNYSEEKRVEKHCLDKNTNLDTAKKELEKRMQETDIFLRSIFCGVTMVTERKKVLDNLREQIKKQLEETEDQSEETEIKFKSNHYGT
ncbi:butyrophilin subfamily 3 member A2-like [Epinephelus fuscoguttatus]|uniref:butyrophilin subfamily 3 member A2-like n=1 Tax=Epinephelus fuscoguttatus TaxID=293821 RepID=UPI0020D19506|nr:butyrophilin subfamily 3 member A2-like [Epinephelus fuscoguttatus]